MDPLLKALKRSPASNDPLFYPPGSHPAMARMRAALAELLKVEAEFIERELTVPDDIELCKEYYTYNIAAFEERESERKQRILYQLTRDRRG